jgi:uncharacterized damage-inducible protein DinB/predicted RNase H-like HicB family nuclease
MARYAAYLEWAEEGPCMGHVLTLPGCTVRAAGRAQVLEALPEAIRAYHAWLRGHREAAPPDEEAVDLYIAGEVGGIGPFRPGDAAALFPPDREPLTDEEMEAVFRLMGYARADLLALAGNLDEDFLDWEPGPGSWTLRRVLRHVGNAEEWYVSRLVLPEGLPAQWQDDEGLPLWDFLEMERRTALELLRALSARERAAVFYPTAWTHHPEEAWTLRKVLRRFLEHEREHTGQVREILELRRSALLAELGDARQELLAAQAKLPAGSQVMVCGDWTARDVLGHVADWEWVGVEGLRLMARGESPLVELVTDLDAWNREHVAARRNQPWDAVLDDLHAARQALLDGLQSVEPALLGRLFPFPWGGEGTPVDWLSVYPAHDREHAEELARSATCTPPGEEARPVRVS